jgi:D-glycero-D-manno-heptose 1,7-bisphosphate phosphatase
MNKAVFLDRDGVINNDEGFYYVYKPEDFIINEGVLDSIAMLSKKGFLVIVISNQGGIAKGIYSKSDTELLNKLLFERVEKHGGKITEIYYCPHHEEKGLCLCRKPSSLLIEKAIARFNIDKNLSYLIGDSQRDIEAARNAGIKGILIPKNSNITNICESIISGEIEQI